MLISAEKLIQSELKRLGHYAGKIDGKRGPVTDKAVAAYLTGSALTGWQGWSSKRRAVAVLQLVATAEGIDAGEVDGFWGPQTEFAFEGLRGLRSDGTVPRSFRDIEALVVDANPNGWPTQSGVTGFYGPPGQKGKATPPPKLARVKCPWTLKIAWDLSATTSTISIHEKCAESLERVLADVAGSYSAADISRLRLDHYGGSYAPRKMRGGTRSSMHSWAIAIDWDPANNKLRDNHSEASMSGEEYDAWWAAWEKEGWLSLGRVRNFDWMHVQAAKLG